MSAPQRSPIVVALQVALLLSGWAAAVALGLRLREKHPEPPPAPAPTAAPIGKFELIFREWSDHPQLAGALVAFCLLDEKGDTLFASPLAQLALCPASALKTVTTGAAFSILGPDFRFQTTLASTAPIAPDGTLAGDLVLIGGGDPTLSQEDLAKLADTVAAAGLKKVAGRLRVDATVFLPDPVSEHWNWGDIGNAYGAGAFGVNVDHNRMEITFEPGAQIGDPAKLLGAEPALRDLRWENYVVTGASGSGDAVVVYSQPYGRTVTLRGTVPAGANRFTIFAAIPDPPALAAQLLRARLEAAGVKFADGSGPFAAGERQTLASHQSAPLPEIVDHLHKVSDNLEAQCFFLTIGRKQSADPVAAVTEFWEKAGVDFVGLRLIDGSGLARANMIRPLDLARVNLAARRGPHGQRFLESLSTYGSGQVRGKIGGMSGVKTQVGFIQTTQGRELTFALFGNGLQPGREFWKRLEELLETVRTTEL